MWRFKGAHFIHEIRFYPLICTTESRAYYTPMCIILEILRYTKTFYRELHSRYKISATNHKMNSSNGEITHLLINQTRPTVYQSEASSCFGILTLWLPCCFHIIYPSAVPQNILNQISQQYLQCIYINFRASQRHMHGIRGRIMWELHYIKVQFSWIICTLILQ